MNKSELVKAVSERADVSQAAAAKMLDATLSIIGDTLANKDDVSLIGFGTFSLKHRAERQGKNPQTGEPLTIKATNSPHFKPGKPLKDLCNN